MTDDELESVLEDLERKGWAERTEHGWKVTDMAKAMIEKYGEKKAMEFSSFPCFTPSKFWVKSFLKRNNFIIFVKNEDN